MTGIVDVGGGMRGIFSAGIYDCLLDEEYRADYCIGVSAGSANMTSYLSGQKERVKRFYTDYSCRPQYMGMGNFIKKGSYLDLDYIYSTLSNSGGEDALDYEAMQQSSIQFKIVATKADDSQAVYFSKSDIPKDDLSIIKASCCLPFFCRPIEIDGVKYFDGGVADPIPVERAFRDGCDHVAVILTKPVELRRTQEKHLGIIKAALRRYPKIYESIAHRHEVYNSTVDKLLEYEKEGRVTVLAPTDCFGVDTLTKEPEALEKLYRAGYECAQRALGTILR